MFAQASVVAASTMKAPDITNTKRSTANFHPSIWKDHFLSFSDDALKVDDAIKERAELLKEEVRKMLVAFLRNPLEKLKLVDSIQRLGVSYHFENEIDQILEQIYMTYSISLSKDSGENLYTTALLFRLLRQQGYQISCDIFQKFIETNGKFKESLSDDARGILSLYEAAHMRGHGEDVLEEALDFTIRHLKELVNHSRSPFVNEVSNALKLPIRKDIPRKKAREYMVFYQADPSHNDILLTFSKLDFNILQKLHQKELREITRWWKNLEVPTNFPFARDRIVECYFWTLGTYFEPHFSIGRKILTKIIAISSILDDIYDAYGTLEELQVLTPAIQRWNRSMVNILPEYMKSFYIAMLDVYAEISKEIGKNESSYHMHIAKEGIKKLAESYFQEAKWLNEKYRPNVEEYMELALRTTGYTLLISISYLGMGDIVTNDVLEWLSKGPKIIEASKTICRLMDDIVGHKFEQERHHFLSAVECYMEQSGFSEEEACSEIYKQVVDAWKDINEACLHPIVVPMPILIRVVNFSRIMHLTYMDEDGYTNAKNGTKFLIKYLLVDPVPC